MANFQHVKVGKAKVTITWTEGTMRITVDSRESNERVTIDIHHVQHLELK